MANVIQGTYTIREVLQITKQFVPNRFRHRKRDVIKRITVQKVIQLSPDRPKEPSVRYEIRSFSYPQYKPYIYIKGKQARKQRSIRHQYDTILTLDRLSIDTKSWKIRTGTTKNWESKPPQKYVKQIYRETRKLWNKKQIQRHKKKAPYLDVGDYNSREKGLNGDWIFRQAFAFWKAGHFYGNPRQGKRPSSLNKKHVVWFDKHQIHIIESLMINGILKKDSEEMVETR